MRAVLWQEMLDGRQFGKGDLLSVTGYLKERHWTDSQGQSHRVNELVVTDYQAPAEGNWQTTSPSTTARNAEGRGSRGSQAEAEAAQRHHPGRGYHLRVAEKGRVNW